MTVDGVNSTIMTVDGVNTTIMSVDGVPFSLRDFEYLLSSFSFL